MIGQTDADLESRLVRVRSLVLEPMSVHKKSQGIGIAVASRLVLMMFMPLALGIALEAHDAGDTTPPVQSSDDEPPPQRDPARPATAPAALLLVGYLVHRAARSHAAGNVPATETRQALRSVLGLALTAGSGVLFNLMIFDSVGGGAAGRTSNWVEEFGAPNMFAGSLLTGLAGLTVSPSRGILVFSPILVLALVGGYRVWRTRLATLSTREAQDAVLLGRYATLGSVAILMAYSQYLVWWGGHGFGPRYLTDLMPLATLLFVFGLADPVRPAQEAATTRPTLRLRSVAVVVLCAYSIGIQALGAFCWPSPWTLDGASVYVARLWDWRDNQIVSCIRAGPRVDPMTRRLFERLGL